MEISMSGIIFRLGKNENKLNCFKSIVLGLSLFVIYGCTENVATDVPIEKASSTLTKLMKEAIDNSYNHIPGISLAIKSPKLEGGWEGIYGYDSVKKEDTLSIDQPFRIASITKTFVATSILKLHEMDSLNIHEPISKYISPEHISILKSGGYDPDQIQLYHCLNHTSGLFDYAMNGSDYASMVKKSPQHRWTRTEQLQLAMDFGDPAGKPGDKYLYSDTGYILLGEIIETFYNGDLAKGLRDLIGFDELGMNHTWLESLEPEPMNLKSPVKRYFGRDESSTFDPSMDLYGGGGLMSTSGDLTIFLQALFNQEILENESTLDLMLKKHKFESTYIPDEDPRFKDYRSGLWKVTLYGDDAYMHSGLWGTTIVHIPAQNSSYAVNFTRGWSNRLLKKAILLVNNIEES